MKELISRLKESGFKETEWPWGDAYDRGRYRVYFDDLTINIVRFNNQPLKLVEWRGTLDAWPDTEKTMKIIQAMTED